MRPTRIEIEGFTCFREKVVVDFENVELFALSGRTGSGKTSILDAMIFALYGKVPRLSQSVRELVTTGLARARIQLDFRIGNDAYRVGRVLRRTGGNEALLEQVNPDGSVVGMTDQVRATEREVARVLGLSYEAFVRSIVLPQGEFSKFMRGTTAERQRILERLLRHHVYALMAIDAGVRESEFKAEVRLTTRLLTEEYDGVSAGAVATLEREVTELDEAQQTGVATAAALEQSLATLREQHGWSVELANAEAMVRTFGEVESEMALLERRLDAAQRAATVQPVIDRHRRVLSRHNAAQQQRDEATLALEHARSEQRAAADAAHAARDNAAEREALVARRQALNDVTQIVLPQLRDVRAQQQLAEQRLAEQTTRCDARRQAVTRLEQQLAELDENLAALQDALANTPYDGARHQRLRAVSTRFEPLRRLREDGQQLADALARAKLAHEAAEAKRTACETTEREATAALQRVTAEATALRAEVDEIERMHQAQHLREHLRVGEPCPVCEQRVDAPPEHSVISELVAPLAELERVQAQLAPLQRATRVAQDQLVVAQTEARTAENAVKEAHAATEQNAEAVRANEAELRRQVGDEERGEEFVEVRLAHQLQRLEATRADRDLRQQKIDEQLVAHTHKTDELAKAREAIDETLQQIATLTQDRRRLAEHETALTARLAALTDVDDPAAEQARLTAEIEALDEALQQCNARLQDASTAAAVAERDVATRAEAWTAAQTELREVEANLQEALQRAGFEDQATCEATFLTPEQVAHERQRLAAHRDATRDNEARIATLRAQLGETRVTEAQVKHAQQALEAAQEANTRRVEELGKQRERLHTLRERLVQVQELEEKLKVHRRNHEVYAQLSSDLRATDRFRAWLLREAFNDLCVGASQRLFDLSQRYTLQYDGRNFCVVDHDNAQEVRRADTLSGGETFLCSLALALELSEQIQRNSGAVRLESLFIDEGFGTLDGESLETVAEAVETLPMAGRLVGIITHIDDLTQRLPHRIEVTRETGGSRLEQRNA